MFDHLKRKLYTVIPLIDTHLCFFIRYDIIYEQFILKLAVSPASILLGDSSTGTANRLILHRVEIALALKGLFAFLENKIIFWDVSPNLEFWYTYDKNVTI